MEKGKTKFLVTLGILLLGLAIAAVPAKAQGQTNYNVFSSSPTMRAEGLIESAGTVSLTEGVGTSPTAQFLNGSSISIAYAAPITNAPTVLDVACNVLGTGAGALASVNCTGPGFVVNVAGNVFTISLPFAAGPVALMPADVFVVTGVRVNASTLGAGVPLFANLSATSANPVTDPIGFDKFQVQVGQTSASLTATIPIAINAGTLTGAFVAPALNPALLTCVVTAADTPAAIATGIVPALAYPTGAMFGPAFNVFAITVAENFPSALATAAQETLLSPNSPATVPTQIDVILTGIPAGFTVTSLTA